MSNNTINRPYNISVNVLIELERLKVMYPSLKGNEIVEGVIWSDINSYIKPILLRGVLTPGYIDAVVDILDNFTNYGPNGVYRLRPNEYGESKIGRIDFVKEHNNINRVKVFKWVKSYKTFN